MHRPPSCQSITTNDLFVYLLYHPNNMYFRPNNHAHLNQLENSRYSDDQWEYRHVILPKALSVWTYFLLDPRYPCLFTDGFTRPNRLKQIKPEYFEESGTLRLLSDKVCT